MAVRPILFSGPMVRALLDGRKTQTRRVLTSLRIPGLPESTGFTLRGDDLARALQNAEGLRRVDEDLWTWSADAFDYQAPATRTTWYARIGFVPGDLLYVREQFRQAYPKTAFSEGLVYRADRARALGMDEYSDRHKWKPSIHMPRRASRLTLRVTDVRVQRVQDISEGDAQAEGVALTPDEIENNAALMNRELLPHIRAIGGDQKYPLTCRSKFVRLWDSLNVKRGFGWDVNPWVVAVTFDVIQKNVDALPPSPRIEAGSPPSRTTGGGDTDA